MPLAELVAPSSVRRRRPGRPAVATIPAEKARHIRCAGLLLGSDWLAKEIARLFDVHRDTVYHWTRLALTYDGPEADALRALAARSRRRIA